MGKTTRLLFVLLAFLMGTSAFAQCTIYAIGVNLQGAIRYGAEFKNPTDACLSGFGPLVAPYYPTFTITSVTTDQTCSVSLHLTSEPNPGTGNDVVRGTLYTRTGNSTECNSPCNKPYCDPPPPDQCGLAPGSKIKQNFSEGWARSSDINKLDYVGKVNLPFFVGGGEDGTQLATHCIDKCKARATKVLDRYRAKTPGPNGLYRLSGDYEFDVIGTSASGATGDTCSTANNTQSFNDAVSPNTVPLPCPGTVGEVNGKSVCIPGTSPSTSIPPPSGEPPPGTEQSGNPRAGDIPTTGEGSGSGGAGRTPTAGNGTAAGGPSAAASSGGGSTGTTPKPPTGEEQAACGAPGQPPCKIDETGTPTQGNFSDGEQRLEQAKTDAIAEINKVRTGQGFTWTFQLPTGCQPLQLPAFAGMIDSIDICQFQPMIHDLLSMIWIAATIFALWGMASRAFASE